jgi:hypothetical protein
MRSGLTREGVAAHKAAIREFFTRYHAAFHAIIQEGSDDLDPLLEFFSVPLTITTRETHLTLQSGDAILAAFRDNVARQRQGNYERSVPERMEFRILNDRSFLAEVDWVRTGKMGQEFSILRMLYLGAETDQGLRITSLVILGEPPEDVRVHADSDESATPAARRRRT